METETTSVNISYTTPLGKKSSRAFTNVDPHASDSEIVNFSEAMNDLTTNTLTATSKITKKDIDLSATYYDLTVEISDSNNDNDAITISGNTVTVDPSKCEESTDIYGENMTGITIVCKVDGTRININNLIVEQTDCNNRQYVIQQNSGNVDIGFYNNDSAQAQTVKITIPDGVSGNKHYNGKKITINIV